MIERPRALEERGAGLADGLKTVAPDTGSLPRGGTPGEAQSERVKRGSRHDDQGVASSTRRSGDGHSTGSAQGGGSARPARSQGAWDRLWFPSGCQGWSSYAPDNDSLNQQIQDRS